MNGYQTKGGAVYCTGSELTIRDCVFQNNTATTGGGAIYNYNSDPIITACVFEHNTAGLPAGETGDGGAILNSGSDPTVQSCLFIHNEARNTGGAIHSISHSASRRCNPSDPGCPCAPIRVCERWQRDPVTGIYYCTGWTSICTWTVSYSVPSSPKMTNCTFVENVSTNGAALDSTSGQTTVRNCILWGNTPDQVTETARTTVTYSDVQGGFGR